MLKKPIITQSEARALSEKFGTPIYIYRKDIIEQQYRNLESIPYLHKKIYFACKANSNGHVLRFLKTLGANIETISAGEVQKALRTGFKPKDISFTCSNIMKDELVFVARKKILVHIDSLHQLKWWGEKKLGKDISLRINSGYGSGQNAKIITGGDESKFGIYHTDLPMALKIAKRFNLNIRGLQQHIGSNILDEKKYLKGVKSIIELSKIFPNLTRIDVGGGIGIPYHPNEKEFEIKKFGNIVAPLFKKLSDQFGRNMEVRFEPGRYLVAQAGALLVTVTDIKKTKKHIFVGVNSGMNHMIRYAMYDAYHHVHNLSNPKSPKKNVVIVGNICESGDILAKQKIPMPKIGDLLLISDTGAYGYSMASDYNSRPKPKEVVI